MNEAREEAASPGQLDDGMAAGERGDEMGLLLSLRAWVDWLVVAYALFDEWPECWYRHTALINELLALQRWHGAALTEEPAASQLAQWHDGLARVRERAIRPLLQSCHATGHVDPSAENVQRNLDLRERMAAAADAYWGSKFVEKGLTWIDPARARPAAK